MLTSREATEVPRLGTGYPFIAANIKSKLRSRSPQNAQHFTSRHILKWGISVVFIANALRRAPYASVRTCIYGAGAWR